MGKFLAWFLAGLACLAVGIFLVVLLTRVIIVQGLGGDEDATGTRFLRFIGLLIAIGGPIFFWIVLPVGAGVVALLRGPEEHG